MYDPILPDLEQWPIVKLNNNKEQFLADLEEFAMAAIIEKIGDKPEAMREELARTLYHERIRVYQKAWKADRKDEKAFWSTVKHELVKIEALDDSDGSAEEALMRRILKRYVTEISSEFDPKAYQFAKWVSSVLFSRLLNASQGKGISRFWKTKKHLHERIHLIGETDQLRALAKKGTVIMVPTHFSNLDSILVGWAIQSLGLPPFTYGAGLNLFGIKLLAYFMNRLGAYKVDRRKKNRPYLEALKGYSILSLSRGCHGLFFPGGTRSRSGKIETRLKLGLLSSAIESQRLNFLNEGEKAKKIFVCPVVINYNFVLEAPALIEDELRRSGQEHYYVENDDYSTSYKMGLFLMRFFTAKAEMAITFGRCMDLFGNDVTDEGESLDRNGNHVDISKYYMSDGKITKDLQRDGEYTSYLGNEIVKRYHKENLVQPPVLIAFTLYQLLQKKYPKLDLFAIIRLPEEDRLVSKSEFNIGLQNVIDRLKVLESEGNVRLPKVILEGELEKIIEVGLKGINTYHAKKPIKLTEEGLVTSEDMKVLYFYHNRLDGYNLHHHV
jgi:glycerol-3-phosphate O-acyltransferase